MSKRSRFVPRGIALTAAILLLLALAASAALPADTAGEASGSQAEYVKAAGGSWYLAEGCTGEGFETWVLVQNPNPIDIEVDLNFMTGSGLVQGPQNVPMTGYSRISFNLGGYVTDWDVSTKVTPDGGNIICERAMYGNDRTWAHESIGTVVTSDTWYLAEGCTGPGFETWVLVQNPGTTELAVDLTFMTGSGRVAGPQNFHIPGNSRHSFNVADYVTDWDVSTMVTSNRPVVCERAMYGNDRTWAHDSIGSYETRENWFLPEGCTGPGFETWVLVQNPGDTDVNVDLVFNIDSHQDPGPTNVLIPAHTRRSFNVGDYVTDYEVSTRVSASDDTIVCERAMYDTGRTWGHDSLGARLATTWNMAEGCTAGGMETWLLVQNPTAGGTTVNVDFMTSSGLVQGPQDFPIPGYSRTTFNVGDYVIDYDVSIKVTSNAGGIACERAMYGEGRTWAHDSIGFGVSPL